MAKYIQNIKGGWLGRGNCWGNAKPNKNIFHWLEMGTFSGISHCFTWCMFNWRCSGLQLPDKCISMIASYIYTTFWGIWLWNLMRARSLQQAVYVRFLPAMRCRKSSSQESLWSSYLVSSLWLRVPSCQLALALVVLGIVRVQRENQKQNEDRINTSSEWWCFWLKRWNLASFSQRKFGLWFGASCSTLAKSSWQQWSVCQNFPAFQWMQSHDFLVQWR